MRRTVPLGVPHRLQVGGTAGGLTRIPRGLSPQQSARRRRIVLILAVVAAHVLAFGLPRILASPPTAEQVQLEALLQQVRIVDQRVESPGYSRENFGHGWGKVVFGNALCSTREVILNTQLTVEESDGCTVVRASGVDPYTLAPLVVGQIDIDHVFPLSAAWDLGAAQWTLEQRINFANDRERNLVAVDSAVNRRKSDGTPDEWMPPNKTQHCWYATRYVQVAQHYGLAVTTGDARTLRRACKPQSLWKLW